MSHALLVLNIFAEDRNFLQYDYTPVTLFLQLLLNIFAETRKFLSCSNINDPEMRKECKKQVVLEEYERLSPDLLFEIIRQDGEEELHRSTKALVYSGIAAGIVISSSFLFKAVLMEHTSFVSWGNLIASLGYTVGFIIVILGRMQLFTENTITTVVPLFYERSMKKFIQVVRLWGIVLLSNLIGTCLAAAFLSNSLLVSADVAVQLHGELVTQVTAYLQSKYDLAHVVVVSNSDGGSGYGKDVFGSLVIGCKQHAVKRLTIVL